MNVKTADLKNNLSKYLGRIQETGETIVVCDRDKPVAVLAPIERDDDTDWRRYRTEALARARKIGMKIDIPMKRPSLPAGTAASPSVAPDGHADIVTIDLLRKGRDY